MNVRGICLQAETIRPYAVFELPCSSSQPMSDVRPVAFYRCDAEADMRHHDLATRSHVSRSLATLLGVGYAGDWSDDDRPVGEVYWVPSSTLAAREAQELGIRGVRDLFGGVVPQPFVATKVITHPLVSPDAVAPEGWAYDLGESLGEVVLPGYSVFSAADAKAAGAKMLESGAVRLKAPDGIGGNGQSVARTTDELVAQLNAIEPEALGEEGLVLELNLTADVATYSVGQVMVGQWLASYVGTQRLARNRHGAQVYGGSDLMVMRGTYDDLLSLDLKPGERSAIEQALVYHRLTMAAFDGLFASRCNYDVVQGTDACGKSRSGVLEQSWRIGGASGAELAALLAFRREPSLRVVLASTHEVYADKFKPPPGAEMHFDDVDPHVGRIVKYSQVTPYAQS
jgi:hypothetical protein